MTVGCIKLANRYLGNITGQMENWSMQRFWDRRQPTYNCSRESPGVVVVVVAEAAVAAALVVVRYEAEDGARGHLKTFI